jgi:hypothetical protein
MGLHKLGTFENFYRRTLNLPKAGAAYAQGDF